MVQNLILGLETVVVDGLADSDIYRRGQQIKKDTDAENMRAN